jgi:hypothetical protein
MGTLKRANVDIVKGKLGSFLQSPMQKKSKDHTVIVKFDPVFGQI